MKNNNIIHRTQNYVKETLSKDCTGHDWWHVYRVWKTARHIAKTEGGDLFVIELAALLHDIADWKFHQGDTLAGVKTAKIWLSSLDVADKTINHVGEIISSISFKGAKVETKTKSKEAQIVQDADRLDALGAIGIGRTFAYGGYKKREMYNPEISPAYHTSFEAYQKNKGTTINHFYEKLFLLKELMNTDTAKKLAEEKHRIMENFVAQFLKEWQADYE